MGTTEAKMVCSVSGCSKAVVARGLCPAHYAKWRKYGDPREVRQVQLHGLTLADRFWQYVKKSARCWEWVGHRDPNGYGRINVGGVPMLAHRASWMLSFGDPGTMSVLHKCDNPKCVRPSHLFVGSQADNLADMTQKGRRKYGVLRGAAHGRAKLTDEQVREIRASAESSRALSAKYGVSATVIKDIRSRKIWRHIE